MALGLLETCDSDVSSVNQAFPC